MRSFVLDEKLDKDLKDMIRRDLLAIEHGGVRMKWPCYSGHAHETPEEARECIDELISDQKIWREMYKQSPALRELLEKSGPVDGIFNGNSELPDLVQVQEEDRVMAAVREIARGS